MNLTHDQKWLLGGALGGAALVLGVGVWRKTRQLMRRAEQIQKEGSSTELARKAQAMREDLGDFGERYANELATKTGEKYMAETYGLTKRRIARMEELGSALGVG